MAQKLERRPPREEKKKKQRKPANGRGTGPRMRSTVTRVKPDQHPRPPEARPTEPMATPSAKAPDKHPRPVTPPRGKYRRVPPPPPPTLQRCGRSQIQTTGANGDEALYPNYLANYHKGLPHDQFGQVTSADYQLLLTAMQTKTQPAFAAIPLGGERLFVNPQSGLAKDLEGPRRPWDMKMRSAPAYASAEAAAEAVELYWMALLRDVAFTEFSSNALVTQAAGELSSLQEFTGPKENNQVVAGTIFRGCTAGDAVGPYLSQFLLKPIPYGPLNIDQRIQTVAGEALLGVGNADYMVTWGNWRTVQDGSLAYPPDRLDGTERYIRNMRDLARYVQVDALYEAYLNACLILLGMSAPFDAGNPYRTPHLASRNQMGFGTFGGPHILSLVCEAATRALKAVWYQKWFVHRRHRPEAYGGLIHFVKAQLRNFSPPHQQVMNSQAVAQVHAKFGTYFLPMAYPEGSPLHPSYGAGHATVAGACVTILKAFFDESTIIPDPVVPTIDGLQLVPYTGPGAGALTVGGELDKLAANIAIGRNMAGVHWRSDYLESVRLGERVAVCILNSQRDDYHEPYSFSFTSFDGRQIQINKNGVTGYRQGFQPCRDRDVDVL